jgi:hypothetical protein
VSAGCFLFRASPARLCKVIRVLSSFYKFDWRVWQHFLYEIKLDYAICIQYNKNKIKKSVHVDRSSTSERSDSVNRSST